MFNGCGRFARETELRLLRGWEFLCRPCARWRLRGFQLLEEDHDVAVAVRLQGLTVTTGEEGRRQLQETPGRFPGGVYVGGDKGGGDAKVATSRAQGVSGEEGAGGDAEEGKMVGRVTRRWQGP